MDERVRKLNNAAVRTNGRYVLYWCRWNRRLDANHAVAFAAAMANRLDLPLLYLESLTCDYPYASDRLHTFALQGMPETAARARKLGIGCAFHVPRRKREDDGAISQAVGDAAAVVTDSGGMTCHAAIVSRELGIPCVVGTGDATQKLRDGEPITVNATDGTVLSGISAAPASPATVGAAAAPASLATVAVTGTRLLVNLSEPSQAQAAAMLDVDGVGLLRAELMIVEALDGVHPRTLLAEGRGNQFVERMAAGLNTFASAFAPRPITYRTTDSHAGRDRGSRRRGGRRRPSRGADQAR